MRRLRGRGHRAEIAAAVRLIDSHQPAETVYSAAAHFTGLIRHFCVLGVVFGRDYYTRLRH
jgi:hypothetical protein